MPVGVGDSCIESREGGRMPEPDALRPACPLCFSLYSCANFVNKDLAARGITPARVNLASKFTASKWGDRKGYVEDHYPSAKGRFVQ